jgi:lipopolysaccharide exporter
MASINTFTQTGFQAALVHKRGDITNDLNTAWTIGLIRAFILCLIVFFAAPFLASLNVPEDKVALTISIIRVMGFSFLISALANPGVIYFSKEMEFHKRFIIEMSGTLVGIIFSAVVVIIYKSVWSIVLGRVLGNIVRCILSYVMHSHRPKLVIDLRRMRRMWSFGKWVFGSSILNFINVQGDDFLVWWYIDVASLGIYRLAFRFGTIPVREITQVVSRISFPAFSKLQGDLPRLRDAYFKMLKVTAFFSIPIAGMIFILTPEFVVTFINKPLDELTSLIPVMQALAIFGMISSIGSTTGSILQAIGRPSIITKILVFRTIVLALVIFPLTKYYGILGTAIAVVIAAVVIQPGAHYQVLKHLKCGVSNLILAIIAPLLSTALMVLIVWGLKNAIGNNSIIVFALLSVSAVTAYLVLMLTMDIIFGMGYRTVFSEQLKVFKRKSPS